MIQAISLNIGKYFSKMKKNCCRLLLRKFPNFLQLGVNLDLLKFTGYIIRSMSNLVHFWPVSSNVDFSARTLPTLIFISSFDMINM